MLPIANVLPILDCDRKTEGFLNRMCSPFQSTAYIEKIVAVGINHYYAAAEEFLEIAIVYYEFAKSARRFTKF